MRIINQLSDFGDTGPCVITIGSFDGVHLGHWAVLQRVRELKKQHGGFGVVVTFANHPSEVLRPAHASLPIYSSTHKVKLLADQGVDVVVCIPFTSEFSVLSAEDFLQLLQSSVSFSHLILGYDAVFGRQGKGQRSIVESLAKKRGFCVEYVDPVTVGGAPVSSTTIRTLIGRGDLDGVSRLLGRTHCITGKIIRGQSRGQELGYPTANIDVSGLCLPPYGVYAVSLTCGGRFFRGMANLGVAPTLRNNSSPLLEVFLFDYREDLHGNEVEVFLHRFIRRESLFTSIEALREQIAQDARVAKEMLRLPHGATASMRYAAAVHTEPADPHQ